MLDDSLMDNGNTFQSAGAEIRIRKPTMLLNHVKISVTEGFQKVLIYHI